MSAGDLNDKLAQALGELEPLLSADGGGVELVSFDEERREVVLRFTGAFAVCPGTPIVKEDLLEPFLRKAMGGRATFRYQR